MKQKHDNGFPTRDAIVAFIRANPGKVGTREIAREFGLKNADRAELKRILRDLADQGSITRQGKKVVAIRKRLLIDDFVAHDCALGAAGDGIAYARRRSAATR